MKYFLIAGEASGDLHTSYVMRELKQKDPNAVFRFAGGDKMSAVAGTEPVVHYRDMAFMGVWDVIKNLHKVKRNFTRIKDAVKDFRPDAVILTDYPGFNLRMAQWSKQQGYKVFYYISPKLWAWKENRVRYIRDYVDKLFVILPFEKEFYRRHGIDVTYVGNPVEEEMEEFTPLSRDDFLRKNRLDDKPLVALLPGSRVMELKYMLPVMSRLPSMFPEYQWIIAGAPSLDEEIYRRYARANIPVLFDQTYDILHHARAAVVTSGTATLETALAGTPQVTGYKTMALQYHLGKHLIKVPYISLVNLILDRPLIPELLQGEFNTRRIADTLAPLLSEGASRQAMLDGYAELRRRLGPLKASRETAEGILKSLGASGQVS